MFEISDDGIEIVDLFGLRTKFLSYQDFKGYSTGVVRTRFNSFQQVILYAWNGDVYQIIQRNFRNFNHLKKAIKQGGNLTYLGKERLRWTWRIALKELFVPHYKFR
ncbi:hypothetical protein GCM10027185_45460 [Spirosoma pulveris]